MKKQTISGFTLKLLLLLVVIALYVNLYYFPLDKKIAVVKQEIDSYQAASAQYAEYWRNPALLDAKIKDLRAAIYEKGKTTNNANPINIADDVSSLLQKTGATLSSITVGEPLSQEIKSADGKSTLYAVPIQLILNSSEQSNIAFVTALENFKSGAYSVDSVSYSGTTNGSFSVSLQMKFFTSAG